MPANNRRKNPFTLAPALTFVVLAFFVFFSFFELQSHILMGFLTLLVFFSVFAAYLVLRGSLITRIPNRKLCKRGIVVALLMAVLMILFSGLWRFGICRDTLAPSASADSFFEGILMFFTSALLPAVCEEYFFRGIVQLEYRFAGVVGSAICSALLFSAVHLSFSMFPLYFVCGLFLSWLVFLTGDVKMAVLAHLFYNVYALFFEKYVYLLALDSETVVLFFTIFGVLFLLAMYAVLKFSALLLLDRDGEEEPVRIPAGKGFWVFSDIVSAPSLWLCLLVFAAFSILDLFL